MILAPLDALTRTRPKAQRLGVGARCDSVGAGLGGAAARLHQGPMGRSIRKGRHERSLERRPTVRKGNASRWTRSKHGYSSTIIQSCRPSDAK